MPFSYKQLQTESRAWIAHNFNAPDHYPLEPVLGLIEEVGEFHEHTDPPEEADALADITIFAADVCNGYGLDLEVIVARAGRMEQIECSQCDPPGHKLCPHCHGTGKLDRPRAITQSVLVTLGKLAHHALKDKQGIRGSHEEHLAAIEGQLVCLFEFVNASCRARGLVLLPLVEKTWNGIVKKRDWRPAQPETESLR